MWLCESAEAMLLWDQISRGLGTVTSWSPPLARDVTDSSHQPGTGQLLRSQGSCNEGINYESVATSASDWVLANLVTGHSHRQSCQRCLTMFDDEQNELHFIDQGGTQQLRLHGGMEAIPIGAR